MSEDIQENLSEDTTKIGSPFQNFQSLAFRFDKSAERQNEREKAK